MPAEPAGAAGRVSGTEHVNFEKYEFVQTSTGNQNIIKEELNHMINLETFDNTTKYFRAVNNGI